MDELEQLRMKRMQEMQQEQEAVVQQEAMLQQQILQLEAVIKQRMTKEALQRYGNIKSAHPEKTIQLLVVLGKAMETGQLKQIDDNLLVGLLEKMQSEKKQFNIRRV